MPASPAITTIRSCFGAPARASAHSCESSASSRRRPTSGARARARSSLGSSTLETVGSPGAAPPAPAPGLPGRSSRVCASIASGDGAVPSSSRNSVRSRSNTRRPSATFPRAASAVINSTYPDSRYGSASIRVRAARSTEPSCEPPSRSPARPTTSSACSRVSSSSRRGGSSHRASEPGRSPRLAMLSGTWASAQAARASPCSSACPARWSSAVAASKSTHTGSGSVRISSSRPDSAAEPSAERSRESSVRSAASSDAGALSVHTAPISSSRPTWRERFSRKYASSSRTCLPRSRSASWAPPISTDKRPHS